MKLALALAASSLAACAADGITAADARGSTTDAPPDAGAPDAPWAPDATSVDADGAEADAGPQADAGGGLLDTGAPVDRATLTPCGAIGLPMVRTAVASRDGARIAVATRGGEVLLYTPDGALLWRTRAHAGPTHDVALSPRGDVVYSYGADGEVRAFDAQDGAPRWSRRRAEQPPPRARLAAAEGLLAVGGHQVELFDAAAGAPRGTARDPALDGRVAEAAAAVALSHAGDRVAAAYGRDVVLFDVATGARTATLSGDLGVAGATAYQPEVQSLAFTADDTALLVAVRRAYFISPGADRYPVARLYRLADGASLFTLTGRSSYGVTASLALDDRHVAVASGGAVEWWTARDDGGWIAAPSAPVALAPRGAEVRAAGDDRVVIASATGLALAAASGEVPLALSAGDPSGRTLAVSAEGDAVLRSTSDDTLELWRLSPADARGQRAGRRVLVVPAARGVGDVSDDGTWVASATVGALRRWSSADGAEAAPVAVGPDPIAALAFDGPRAWQVAYHRPDGARPSAIARVDDAGHVTGERTAVGVVAQLARVPGGFLAVGPSRDHFRGPSGVDVWADDGTLRYQQALETWGPDAAAVDASGDRLVVARWLLDPFEVQLSSHTERALRPPSPPARLAFDPRGAWIAWADQSGRLYAADTAWGGPRALDAAPAAPGDAVVRLRASAAGLVASTVSGETRLYCAAP